ncbi:hypothetical protein MGH68_10650 [Erysipelothrix sp. D19-032]
MKDLLKKVTQMPRDEVNEFLTQKIMQHERVNLVTKQTRNYDARKPR